ncbi:MAG: anthranilate synthase component I family protein, partial [Bacteroidota bacterium]
VDRFYEIDHFEKRIRVVYTPLVSDDPLDPQYDAAVEILGAMRDLLELPESESPSPHGPAGSVESNMTPEKFAAIVGRAQEYIRAGDIFQVNLSIRFSQRIGVDPLMLYRALRDVNPSPYMSCFLLPEMAIVSASPELLVNVHGGMLETRPIAGTRPRGANREEDLANARELIENEKERAEHLMLVDLERNDIGRVARYGSVDVNEFMGIEEYSHVIHIVSNIRGQLAEGRDTFDAIRACFPGGTITGAPKVRSMEIIEELEPCRRGLYTGSIGWIGFNGDAELNIAIRTIVVKDDIAYIQAGAGIVADSVPEREYAESVRKAEAALEAVRRAHHEYVSGN